MSLIDVSVGAVGMLFFQAAYPQPAEFLRKQILKGVEAAKAKWQRLKPPPAP